MADIGGTSTISDALTSEVGKSVLFGPLGAQQLTESDRLKAELVWKLYQKAKRWKAQHFERAQTWWDYWKGRQWARRRPSSLSMAVVNLIYSATETFVGHVADAIEDPNVLARNPSQQATAEIASKLLNWVEDKNDFEGEIELPVRSAIVTGMGVRAVDWDPSMDGHRGLPHQRFVDEATIFFAPHTRRVEDAEYVVEAQNVPLSFIRNRWELGRLVAPGAWDGSLTPPFSGSPYGGYSSTSQTDADLGYFTTTQGTQTQALRGTRETRQADLATLLEAWIRQDDGTLRYLACANGVILQDGPSPYDDEEYPHVVYNVIRNKDSIYGFSLVEQLQKLQDELNQMHSYALDQQRYESDSPLVVNVANAEEGKVFSNAPGSVYIDLAPSGQGYYLLQKPGANPKWLAMQDQVRDMIRSLAGDVDILHGERPAGVTTLGGMEIIREQANVLVQKMMKPIRSAVRKERLKIIRRLRQFLKDERTFIVSLGGNRKTHLVLNERVTMGPGGDWKTRNSIPEDFEAEIDFSSAPPGGYQAKFERAMTLLQGGVVDPQYVLESIDEDHAKVEAVLQRMQMGQAPASATPLEGPGAAREAASAQPAPAAHAPPEDEDPRKLVHRVIAKLSALG